MSLPKWNKAKVIRIIRKWRLEKQPLNSWHVQRFQSALYGAAYKLFGNWPKAIAAAGLKYETVKAPRKHPKWSKEVICETIRRLREVGEKINSNEIQCHHQKLYAAAIKYFRSWGKAVEAAGFDYEFVRIVKLEKWSKTKIIQAIRSRKRRHLSLNGSVVEKEDRRLYKVTRRYFGIGGWRKALKKAGINPNLLPDLKTIWTKKAIVKKIRELHRQKIPLNTFYLDQNGYRGLHGSARKVFGTWKKAIEAAGYSYEKVRKVRHNYWSKRRILAEIRRLARAGVRLNSKGVRHRPGCGGFFGAALKIFGSWSEAVEAAGFDYRLHCKTWSYKAWLRRLERDGSSGKSENRGITKKGRSR